MATCASSALRAPAQRCLAGREASLLCVKQPDGGVGWSRAGPLCPGTGCGPDNGGCEHECVEEVDGRVSCRCTEGFRLAVDGHSCEDPCAQAPSEDEPHRCVDTDECQIAGVCQQMCVNYDLGDELLDDGEDEEDEDESWEAFDEDGEPRMPYLDPTWPPPLTAPTAAPTALGEASLGGRSRSDDRWLLVALLVPACVFLVVLLALGIVYCTRCGPHAPNKSVTDCYRWVTHTGSKGPTEPAPHRGSLTGVQTCRTSV
ncbi:hypothetical protein CB1_000429030 [Camelus ferus]|nr:hypothetical protein CB1_000429030 [Camelus ferus]